GPVETYLLLDPGELPHQVRARVTRSVAYTEHHPVPGGAARVAPPGTGSGGTPSSRRSGPAGS
ncbi:hypothetical protein EAD98_21970, partial [Micromonospora sp. CV4]